MSADNNKREVAGRGKSILKKIEDMDIETIKKILYDYKYGIRVSEIKNTYKISDNLMNGILKSDRLTPEEIANIEARVASDKQNKEDSQRAEILQKSEENNATINEIINAVYPPKTNRIKNMDIEVIKRIVFDYKYGIKLKELRRIHGVSAQTVYNILKSNRLTPNEFLDIERRAKIQKRIDTNNSLIEDNKKLIEQLKQN